MIFDFRMRPPYKGFRNLGIFSPVCNEMAPQAAHARPSMAARDKDLNLFWREMADAGICGGVIMGRQVPNDAASVPNDDVLEMAREFPRRVVPFGSLDISLGVAAAMRELSRIIAAGIKGVALEPAYAQPPRKADANVLYPIYARLEECGIPVVLTMSFFQGNLDYSNPLAAQHVAEDFPDLQIVLAHCCYPWIPMVFQTALVNRNIWLLPDIYMLNPMAPGNSMYGEAMRWLNGERILFGSAWPCYNMEQAVEDIKRFDLPHDIEEKLFWKNAGKLLGIDLEKWCYAGSY